MKVLWSVKSEDYSAEVRFLQLERIISADDVVSDALKAQLEIFSFDVICLSLRSDIPCFNDNLDKMKELQEIVTICKLLLVNPA